MGMRFRLVSVAFGTAASIAAGALATSAVAPGCTVLTNDALPDDAGLFEGGGDASSTACTSCVTQECTGPWAVCLTDSRCVALRACNNPFGESQSAREQCFCDTARGASPPGPATDGGANTLAAYAAFASCNDVRTCGKCATDCSSTCANGSTKSTKPGECGGADAGVDAADGGVTDGGGITDGGGAADGGDAGDAGAVDASVTPAPSTVDACASCVAGKCGDAKKACALGTECSAFLGCAYACADAACVDACGKSRATGKASATELSSCTLISCRSACGL